MSVNSHDTDLNSQCVLGGEKSIPVIYHLCSPEPSLALVLILTLILAYSYKAKDCFSSHFFSISVNILFKNSLVFILCVWEFLPTYKCTTCMQCPLLPEEGVGSLEIGVRVSYELPCECGNWTRVFRRAAELSHPTSLWIKILFYSIHLTLIT